MMWIVCTMSCGGGRVRCGNGRISCKADGRCCMTRRTGAVCASARGSRSL